MVCKGTNLLTKGSPKVQIQDRNFLAIVLLLEIFGTPEGRESFPAAPSCRCKKKETWEILLVSTSRMDGDWDAPSEKAMSSRRAELHAHFIFDVPFCCPQW